MAYYSPPTKRKSLKDLERENKSLRIKLDQIKHASTLVIQQATEMMAKKELAVQILESVNQQASDGLLTRNELFQWRLKWNALKKETDTDTETAFMKIGVESVGNIYQDIYDAQEKLVSEILLGYFLALDEIEQ